MNRALQAGATIVLLAACTGCATRASIHRGDLATLPAASGLVIASPGVIAIAFPRTDADSAWPKFIRAYSTIELLWEVGWGAGAAAFTGSVMSPVRLSTRGEVIGVDTVRGFTELRPNGHMFHIVGGVTSRLVVQSGRLVVEVRESRVVDQLLATHPDSAWMMVQIPAENGGARRVSTAIISYRAKRRS